MELTRLSGEQLSRERAVSAVKNLVNKEGCAWKLIEFDKFKRLDVGSCIQSTLYHDLFVLWHENSCFRTSWMLCEYVMNRFCTTGAGLFEFDTKKGGTKDLGTTGRNILQHKKVVSNKYDLSLVTTKLSTMNTSTVLYVVHINTKRITSFVSSVELNALFEKCTFAQLSARKKE